MSESILWLTPDKPDSISVGRKRIADHLEAAGFNVELRGTTSLIVAKSLLDGGKYDVIIGTTRLGAIAGTVVSRIHGVPLIVDHVDPIRQLRATESEMVVRIVRRLEHLAFRLAAHVLYVYPEEESRIADRATTSSKTDLGVEYDRFADPDSAVVKRAREQLNEDGDKLAVYVGGLEPMYEIKPLLEAAETFEEWTLLVIGTGSLKSIVEQAADDSDSIRFLGTVPHEDVPGYLHLADVGISLVDDPHTLKVLEYGAAGLNVVQRAGRAESRFGGLVEYCAAEPAAIKTAIKSANHSNKDHNLRYYVEQFDWSVISDIYQQSITYALSENSEHPNT